MKKVFTFAISLLFIFALKAQQSDTLMRSAGFYFSPSATGMYFAESDIQPRESFGVNWGYRFVNRWRSGFFLESGLGMSWISAQYPEKDTSVFVWGRYWNYSEQHKPNQIYINFPFLAGYKTNKGKVRFQGSAGFSFNIKYSDFNKVTTKGEDPFGIPGTEITGDVITFGTSFSGILKAGISIPVGERLNIDILPSLRCNFAYMRNNDLDFRKCIFTDQRIWSAGTDVSFIWALNNATKPVKNTANPINETLPDYTYQYETDKQPTQHKKKEKNEGYKNYFYFEALGGGLLYSFNYERTVYRKDFFSMQVRAGHSFIGPSYAFPLGVNVSFGQSVQKFQAGIYSNFESILFDNFNVNIVPELAYRLETNRNFFLRLSLMSHWVTKTGEILPGIGVSIGGFFHNPSNTSQ